MAIRPADPHHGPVKLLTAGLAGLGLVVAATLTATPVLLHQSDSKTRSARPDHAHVKAEKKAGKSEEKADEKPGRKQKGTVPPGLASKGVTKAPGPADAHGKGHAWGRAHAPGQLKDKQDKQDKQQDEEKSGD